MALPNWAFRSFHQTPAANTTATTTNINAIKIPRRWLVRGTKVECTRVCADVRIKKPEEVHERHLWPASPGKRKPFGVVRRVQRHGDAGLPEVRQTAGGVGLGLGATERRQKHASENRDNCNHDQQLNQCERAIWPLADPVRGRKNGARKKDCSFHRCRPFT